jgi:hypothetical protein
MAGETFIHGKTGIFYLHDGTVYRPVACGKVNSLNTTLEVLEELTKCDPENTVKTPGAFSYDIPFDGLQIDTTSAGAEITKASHDYILSLQQAKSLVTWKMDNGLSDNDAYYGTGYITDLTADFDVSSNAPFSGTLSGAGAISTTDPIV